MQELTKVNVLDGFSYKFANDHHDFAWISDLHQPLVSMHQCCSIKPSVIQYGREPLLNESLQENVTNRRATRLSVSISNRTEQFFETCTRGRRKLT